MGARQTVKALSDQFGIPTIDVMKAAEQYGLDSERDGQGALLFDVDDFWTAYVRYKDEAQSKSIENMRDVFRYILPDLQKMIHDTIHAEMPLILGMREAETKQLASLLANVGVVESKNTQLLTQLSRLIAKIDLAFAMGLGREQGELETGLSASAETAGKGRREMGAARTPPPAAIGEVARDGAPEAEGRRYHAKRARPAAPPPLAEPSRSEAVGGGDEGSPQFGRGPEPRSIEASTNAEEVEGIPQLDEESSGTPFPLPFAGPLSETQKFLLERHAPLIKAAIQITDEKALMKFIRSNFSRLGELLAGWQVDLSDRPNAKKFLSQYTAIEEWVQAKEGTVPHFILFLAMNERTPGLITFDHWLAYMSGA